MRTRPPLHLLIFAGLAALASCAPPVKVATAPEFIASYSDAMLRKSARRVLAMEADAPLMLRFARDAEQRSTLSGWDPEKRREELRLQFKNEDLWWKAWCQTRFEGERPHGDHIDVDVSVSGARSEVALVRADDGTLRLHPFPSWLHAEPPAKAAHPSQEAPPLEPIEAEGPEETPSEEPSQE